MNPITLSYEEGGIAALFLPQEQMHQLVMDALSHSNLQYRRLHWGTQTPEAKALKARVDELSMLADAIRNTRIIRTI